jgi:hypothetical protein
MKLRRKIMGLYWKSIIVKVTGCDYPTAGKIENLIDAVCPDCSEVQLLHEAPIALNALNKLNAKSMDLFNKPYDSLTVDEFCEFYELFQDRARNSVKYAA